MFSIHRNHLSDQGVDYVTFGRGDKVLVIITGLSLQGLSDMSDLAIYSLFYRFAKDYKVYIFDRKGIEDFIKNKEDTTEYKRVFEKCGMFLSDTYIIYSDEYDGGSPLENLKSFLDSKFGEYALEDFYDISYKKLVMEIYIEDLKKDQNSKTEQPKPSAPATETKKPAETAKPAEQPKTADTVKPDLSDTIFSSGPILLFNTLLGIGSSFL